MVLHHLAWFALRLTISNHRKDLKLSDTGQYEILLLPVTENGKFKRKRKLKFIFLKKSRDQRREWNRFDNQSDTRTNQLSRVNKIIFLLNIGITADGGTD
jgi:hypothetical protein